MCKSLQHSGSTSRSGKVVLIGEEGSVQLHWSHKHEGVLIWEELIFPVLVTVMNDVNIPHPKYPAQVYCTLYWEKCGWHHQNNLHTLHKVMYSDWVWDPTIHPMLYSKCHDSGMRMKYCRPLCSAGVGYYGLEVYCLCVLLYVLMHIPCSTVVPVLPHVFHMYMFSNVRRYWYTQYYPHCVCCSQQWNRLSWCHVLMPRFDKDRSGNIDAHELQQALTSFGYNL